MYSEEIPALIKAASDRVFSATGKPLTDIQEHILQQALAGKRLKEICVTGFAESTVQRVFSPKLWELLSHATGQRVRINTARLVIEKLLKESQPETAPTASDAIAPLPKSAAVPTRQIPQNLPAHSCTAFIGRDAEVARLMTLLQAEHAAHLVSINGIGGVGKTTLVLEVACRCLRASSSTIVTSIPAFDAIVFASAKQHHLTAIGLLPCLVPRRTLLDILQQIVRTLDLEDVENSNFEAQIDRIQIALSRHRTLLIVDNLETIEDQQEVLAFLYELPPSVKVLITSREQILLMPLSLSTMQEAEALCLIAHEAQEKAVVIDSADGRALYLATGGIPIAIHYAIGQLASGYPLPVVLQQMSQSSGDVAQFCFERSIRPLQGQSAHQLLMAIALFPVAAQLEVLIQIMPQEVNTINHDLAQLQKLSLIQQDQNRFKMLPLTREYALAELHVDPEFERELKQRWIAWYLKFSEQYQQDFQEWQEQFESLNYEWQNLQMVIAACMVEERYADFLVLWRNTQGYIRLIGKRESRRYWDDRLLWSTWLTEIATQRQDWAVMSEALIDRGWLLTAIGQSAQLEEAQHLLEQAWKLKDNNPLRRSKLAALIAVLQTQQQKFQEAQLWLNQAIESLNQSQIEDKERLRQLAEIRYYQGEVLFKTGNYGYARHAFQEAIAHARSANWNRAVFCAQNWLADIAIQMQELDEAQALLIEGLQVAAANHDKCRMAYYKHSLSDLAKAKGNLAEARSWAIDSFNLFEDLGMTAEAEQLSEVLRMLDREMPEVRQIAN